MALIDNNENTVQDELNCRTNNLNSNQFYGPVPEFVSISYISNIFESSNDLMMKDIYTITWFSGTSCRTT